MDRIGRLLGERMGGRGAEPQAGVSRSFSKGKRKALSLSLSLSPFCFTYFLLSVCLFLWNNYMLRIYMVQDGSLGALGNAWSCNY